MQASCQLLRCWKEAAASSDSCCYPSRMTSTQQSVLESKTDRRRWAYISEWWSKEGQMWWQAPLVGSESRPQLGGWTFHTVLVNSQTSDFRFKRLSRNPQFGSGTWGFGNAAMALSQSSFDHLYFTIWQRRTPLVRLPRLCRLTF